MTDQGVLPTPEDTRSDGPMLGSEREVLDHWLDLYRDTVLLKIGGLTAAQLCERSVPPSTMSPIGIVRHLTEVEAYWVRVVVMDEQDVPDYYCVPESTEGDFDDVSPDTAAADVAAYQTEIERSRELLAGWLDRPCGSGPRAAARPTSEPAVGHGPPHRGVCAAPGASGSPAGADRWTDRVLTCGSSPM